MKDTMVFNFKIEDSFFCILFNEKRNALELYNALNGTDYTDVDNLKIATLRDVVYISYKNDAAFIFHETMNLYEEQSTYSPNMPLRGLIYITEMYKQFLGGEERMKRRLYSGSLVTIPTPKYYVFYSGSKAEPENWEEVLSAAYGGEGDVEVTAHFININHGHNEALKNKCRSLSGFSEVMYRAKRNQKTGINKREAVEAAIDECIADGILEDFLRRERSRVTASILGALTEEEIRLNHEDDIREAEKRGREEGRVDTQIEVMDALLASGKFSLEEACDLLNYSIEAYHGYKDKQREK